MSALLSVMPSVMPGALLNSMDGRDEPSAARAR